MAGVVEEAAISPPQAFTPHQVRSFERADCSPYRMRVRTGWRLGSETANGAGGHQCCPRRFSFTQVISSCRKWSQSNRTCSCDLEDVSPRILEAKVKKSPVALTQLVRGHSCYVTEISFFVFVKRDIFGDFKEETATPRLYFRLEHHHFPPLPGLYWFSCYAVAVQFTVQPLEGHGCVSALFRCIGSLG